MRNVRRSERTGTVVEFTPEEAYAAIMGYAFNNPEQIVEFYTTDNVSYEVEYALGDAIYKYASKRTRYDGMRTVARKLLDSIDGEDTP